MRDISKIVIHCSDSEFGNAERIRCWHKEKGWSDIGYHYVINNGFINKKDLRNSKVQDGFIEQGRLDKVAGAHCYGQNSTSIGICLIGVKDFTDAQFKSLTTLLESLLPLYNLTSKDVYGHYDFSKKTCPNFDVQEFLDNSHLSRY